MHLHRCKHAACDHREINPLVNAVNLVHRQRFTQFAQKLLERQEIKIKTKWIVQNLNTNTPAGRKSCDSLIPERWRATRVTKTSSKKLLWSETWLGTENTHCARYSVEALIIQLWPAVIIWWQMEGQTARKKKRIEHEAHETNAGNQSEVILSCRLGPPPAAAAAWISRNDCMFQPLSSSSPFYF